MGTMTRMNHKAATCKNCGERLIFKRSVHAYLGEMMPHDLNGKKHYCYDQLAKVKVYTKEELAKFTPAAKKPKYIAP